MALIPVILVLLPLGKLRHRLRSTLEGAGDPQGSLGSSCWAVELSRRKPLCCSPQGLEAAALPLSLKFGRCLWQADAALGLLRMRGRSEGTEKHHLVKGVLGPARQLQGTRLGLLHVDSPSAQLGWLLFEFLL